MKHSNTTKTFAIAAVAALALAIAPAAKAQVNKGCTNATLTGTFAYTIIGSFVAAPAPLGPYAETGAQTFDGNGNTTAAGMSNSNGTVWLCRPNAEHLQRELRLHRIFLVPDCPGHIVPLLLRDL